MNVEICKTNNPLIRDGTSQGQRQLIELHPHHARIDEHSLSDFMNFAARYGEQLEYFDVQNRAGGDWRDFFDRDIASLISIVANKDNDQYKTLYSTVKAFFDDVKSAEAIENSGALELLFDLIFQLAYEINSWVLKALADDEFKRHLQRLVSSQLAEILSKTIGAYNYASDYGWFTNSPTPIASFENRQPDLFETAFSPLWDSENQNSLYTLGEWIHASAADGSIFEHASSSPFISLRKAGETLLAWAAGFLQAQTQLINDAPRYLFEAIHHWPNHKPHMALYIAFVRLFKFAQIHLNSLTARHLEHYYKKVLGFQPLPATQDRVHVLFELAKQSKQHLLEKDTLLKAGFDQEGNPVQYKLTRELAANKASIKDPGDIKSVFLDRAQGQGFRVYSAAVANSLDGHGKEFSEGQPKWKPFGEARPLEGVQNDESSSTAGLAEIGFALSSPLLDLREGKRTVSLAIYFDSPPVRPLITGDIRVRFSGEKDWIEAQVDDYSINSDHILLVVTLATTAAPVMIFNKEVLVDRNYDTEYPLIEVNLVHQAQRAFSYQNLKDLKIDKIDLTVTVEGLSNLIVQSDLGRLDINKPFQPFGPRPVVGSRFYIGSDEAFKKPVVSMKIDYEWLDTPDDFATYYQVYNEELEPDVFRLDAFQCQISFLNDKVWEKWVDDTVEIFNTPNSEKDGQRIEVPVEQNDTGNNRQYFLPNAALKEIKQYQNDSLQGFISWELAAPDEAFGHKLYPGIYSKRIVKLTADSTSPDAVPPNEPYTPVISKLTLDYVAESSINLTGLNVGSEDTFFHCYPFGSVKVASENSEKISLMPLFMTLVDDIDHENNGELYIGLSDVTAPQMVNLLIQVAEGSADPELNKETIHWSVLSNNRWLTLTKKQLSYDTTNEFNASGIISVTIPDGISKQSNILPDERVWLRASVLKNTRAVCDLIEISTQAGEATFDKQNNDEQFLAKRLPAKSIAKLDVKQSAIKSVAQPYASMDGKAAESSSLFNTRVSERLRDKDRGSHIWDIERLVLQQFPDIYKAKCINHSAYFFERAVDDYFTSEFAPGYVTLIVIPDLSNQNAVNPLEPKASLDKLDKIKTFLQLKMTPFAARKLRVINPQYETIQLEFSVSFHSGFDPSIYLETLNQDIMEFLSPWAFFSSANGKTHKDIMFGGKVHRSILVNFVEEREYVDYITDFKMHQLTPVINVSGQEETGLFNIEEAIPTSARSIFVSHSQHVITAGDQC